MLAHVCETLEEGALINVCVLLQLAVWAAKFPDKSAKAPRKVPKKGPERAAKDATGQVHQSPAKFPCDVSFLLPFPLRLLLLCSFHVLSTFPSSSSDGRMRCVKRGWANTLPMHANARLNLSHVTSGFPLSP